MLPHHNIMNVLRFGLVGCRSKMHFTRMTQQYTQRSFSIISEHRVLPATLMRLNAGRKSNLYPEGSDGTRERQSPDDAMLVSDDGLVRQYVASEAPCPPPLFLDDGPIANLLGSHLQWRRAHA